MAELTDKDVVLLRQIAEHFDGIADGAPDASYPAKMALQFHGPLLALIERAEEDPVQRELAHAHASGDRAWDETVTRLREGGLIP